VPEKYAVTDASVHDSQLTEALLDEKDKGEDFYADSAYSGEPHEMSMHGMYIHTTGTISW